MFGNLNREEIEQVLHHQLVGRIQFAMREGTTYVLFQSVTKLRRRIYLRPHARRHED